MSLARPTAIKVATTDNYIGSPELNLLAFDIDQHLYNQRSNDYDDTALLLDMMGMRIPVGRDTFYHDEEGALFDSFTFASVFSGSGTTTTVYTLSANSMDTYNGINYSPAVAGSIIQFPDSADTQGYIDSIDQTVSPFRVTVISVTGANLPTTTNMEVFYVSRIEPRSGDPSLYGTFGTVPRRYSQQLMEFMEYYEANGYDMQETWYPVKNENGEGWCWQFHDSMRTLMRFQTWRAQSFLLAQKTSTATNSLGQKLRMCDGLLPYLNNNGGGVLNYNIGSKNFGDFVKVVKYLNKYSGAFENFMWGGIDSNLEDVNWLTDAMKNGAITYGAFQGSKEKAIGFSFNSFEIEGFTFHKRDVRTFSNPHALGAGKAAYTNMQIIIPADTRKNNNIDQSSICVRYFKNGEGVDYEYQDYVLGGASNAQHKTSAKNIYQRVLRSSEAPEFIGVNRFLRFQGV